MVHRNSRGIAFATHNIKYFDHNELDCGAMQVARVLHNAREAHAWILHVNFCGAENNVRW